MALFCSKCGTAIVTGSKFCQACGAPAPQPMQAAPPPPAQPQQQWAAPPPVPPPQPQQQWAPPPYAAGQPGPPTKKTGGALKVILIVLGVIVILIVVAVVGVSLFIKKTVLDNVSVKEGPGGRAEVSINTPKGQIKLNSKADISEEKLGVPIYPGARAEEGSGSFSISGGKGRRAALWAAPPSPQPTASTRWSSFTRAGWVTRSVPLIPLPEENTRSS